MRIFLGYDINRDNSLTLAINLNSLINCNIPKHKQNVGIFSQCWHRYHFCGLNYF